MTRTGTGRITIALTTHSDPDMNGYIDTMIVIGLNLAGVLLVLVLSHVLGFELRSSKPEFPQAGGLVCHRISYRTSSESEAN
jgi:hypothetical protein